MKKTFLKIIFLFVMFSQTLSAEYQFSGTHYMASYLDCDPEALRDLELVQDAMKRGVAECGATLLGSEKFIFEPDAITMVLLLSESHASIHTYPEHQACYVDLFTCGDSCDYKKFEEVLCDYLKPAKIESNLLKR